MFPDKANLIAVYLLFVADKKHVDVTHVKCSLDTLLVFACGVSMLASAISLIKECFPLVFVSK